MPTKRARENTQIGAELGHGLDSYFTRLCVLRELADIVNTYLKKSDVFVDCSCGKNDFVPMLKCHKTISYDICKTEGAITQDWLTVKDVPLGSCIGLNPPFGYQGKVT